MKEETRVTPMPISSETTIVRVFVTSAVVGRSIPIATKRALRPTAIA